MGELAGEEAGRSRDRVNVRVKKQSVSISKMEKRKGGFEAQQEEVFKRIIKNINNCA